MCENNLIIIYYLFDLHYFNLNLLKIQDIRKKQISCINTVQTKFIDRLYKLPSLVKKIQLPLYPFHGTFQNHFA